MPRYFFNVHDGISLTDEVGTVMNNLDEAKTHSLRMAGALLSAHPTTFWNGEHWQLEVLDEAGVLMFGLIFAGINPTAASSH